MNSRVRWLPVIFSMGLLWSGIQACGGNESNHAGGGDDGGSNDGTLGDGPGPGDGKAGDGQGFGDAPGNDSGPPTTCLGPGGACSTTADCCSGTARTGSATSRAARPTTPPARRAASVAARTARPAPARRSTRPARRSATPARERAVLLEPVLERDLPAVVVLRQAGDACSTAAIVARDVHKAAGETLGICGERPPEGPPTAAWWTVSSAAARAGRRHRRERRRRPECGGPCCSRACAPWGPTGVLVCQPASGCNVVGDLCTSDSDCCGSAGSPAGSDEAGHLHHHVARDGRRLPQPDGLQARRRRVQAADDVVQLVVRLLQRQLRDTGHVQAGQHGRPALRRGPVRERRRVVRVERELLRREPVRTQPRRLAALRLLGVDLHRGVRPVHRQRGLLPGLVVHPRPRSDARSVRALRTGGSDGGSGSEGGTGGTDAGCGLYGQLCTTSSDCCNGVPCTTGRCESPIQ